MFTPSTVLVVLILPKGSYTIEIEGYIFNFNRKAYIGKLVHTTSFHADPTYFPFRKKGEERVISLSGGNYMAGKPAAEDDELPLPPEIERWMTYSTHPSDDQQELDESNASDIENEIVGYNEVSDQYIIRSAGVTKYVD